MISAQERVNLMFRVTAKNEASKVLAKVNREAAETNTRSAASLKSTDQLSRRTFSRISTDIKLATKDFRAGRIGVEEYNAALRFARQEAIALKGSGVAPLGAELTSFNTVMKQTGGNTLSARRGLGTMRSAMGSLAATSMGLSGRLGEVSSIIGQFAFGSLATLGVFGGLAAIGLAFRHIRKDAGDAKDKIKEFIDLDPLGRRAKAEEYLGYAAAGAERERLEATGGISPIRAGLAGALSRFGIRLPIQTREKAEENLRDIEELTLAMEDRLQAGREKHQEELDRQKAEAQRERERAEREAERARKEAWEEMFRLHSRGPYGQFGTAVAVGLRGLWGERQKPTGFALGTGAFEGMGLGLSQTRERVSQTMEENLRTRLGAATHTLATTIEEMSAEIDAKMKKAFKDTADNIKKSGRQLVGALSIAANALAGMITGRTSMLGGAGGLLSGLANLPNLVGISTPLGIASIGFSFLDALTSDRHKNTMRDAHLDALRTHERTKPAATIIIKGLDPMSRSFQMLVDETRREAEAAGYAVQVQPA